MEPWHHDDRATIYHGDCLEVLRALPDASVDAVVTDPPYGLEFMGKEWDAPWRDSRAYIGRGGDYPNGGTAPRLPQSYIAGASFQAWAELWAVECLRVLKPGGHLLAFGGTRTWHRLACAIEDAGFEVRDSIAWLYGSGFPKSLDVSKAIDKAAGAERTERIGVKPGHEQFVGKDNLKSLRDTGSLSGKDGYERPWMHDPEKVEAAHWITAPVTDGAREWSGWGTALKPAHEPIVVARKPLVGTVAANVLEHGTGALNIDACRIGTDEPIPCHHGTNGAEGVTFGSRREYVPGSAGPHATHNRGRWPANVVLDEDQAAELDRQSGWSKTPSKVTRGPDRSPSSFGLRTEAEVAACYADHGGASRFFYVAKAPARERPKVDGTAHPTVKPLTLMRWLCRLVTPPDGVILEPFAGSGTTVEAALLEGFRVIAIEREADYLPLIQARLDRAAAQEPEDEQLTLDASA
jgi:site-specific DNA-methyltransferase (adenine-specific)